MNIDIKFRNCGKPLGYRGPECDMGAFAAQTTHELTCIMHSDKKLLDAVKIQMHEPMHSTCNPKFWGSTILPFNQYPTQSHPRIYRSQISCTGVLRSAG